MRMVLVDGAKSAEPPMIWWGIFRARALRTLPEALRVAMGPSSGLKRGTASFQPGGSSPFITCSNSSASSGSASR